MTLFVTVLHVLVCLVLIVVVLLQRGKGAEVGAMFGGGGAGTMFGSRGAGNFLTRLTSGAAVVFMITSLTLAYFAQEKTGSTLFEEEAPAAESPFAEPETAPGAGTDAGAGTEGSAFEEVTPPASETGGSAFEEAPAAAPSEATGSGTEGGLAPAEPATGERDPATP